MIKIGLLPLYIKFYDDTAPYPGERLESFNLTIQRVLAEAMNFNTVTL
jgi:hypothetical protein